jgi:signal transduction histidine kinase
MHKLDELKMKNSELEKINYELDRFVYSASHDLRAPLTSVLGLLDILRNEIPSGENQHLIDLMVESILKLDTTIRDIVAYSRNNRTEVSIEALRIQPIVEEILRELKYLEGNQFVLSECIKAEDDGVFPCDRIRLTTILKNLISNSIRFRHPSRNPEISIKVQRNASFLDLIVADNGLGINDYHLEKIFDMFYRTSYQAAGSGLGLYIVRETIKKMHGHIEVTSTVNQGTMFHISLPLQGDQNQVSNEIHR